MRGLDLVRPRYDRLVPGDLVTFEAWLSDGRVQREAEGVRYGQIDRPLLDRFVLVTPGEVLLEAPVPSGATGRNLIYRRRSTFRAEERSVLFIVAYAPMGPAIMIDPASGKYRVEDGLVEGDPDMYPVVLLPDEGERFLMDYLTRAS